MLLTCQTLGLFTWAQAPTLIRTHTHTHTRMETVVLTVLRLQVLCLCLLLLCLLLHTAGLLAHAQTHTHLAALVNPRRITAMQNLAAQAQTQAQPAAAQAQTKTVVRPRTVIARENTHQHLHDRDLHANAHALLQQTSTALRAKSRAVVKHSTQNSAGNDT